jgi:electron transport complex protein RnfG
VEDRKEKSTIIKDAMALFIITLVSALALSFVYETTKAPIKMRQDAEKQEAYKEVYSKAASFESDQKLEKLAKQTDLTDLDPNFTNTTIDEINKACDSNGNLVGYIVQVSTKGYKNTINIAFGYSLDGTVQRIEFLALNDTAGLGMNAKKPEFKDQFTNKTAKQFEVTKTGASDDSQINAISSATITSKAVVRAVNAGISFITKNAADIGGEAK